MGPNKKTLGIISLSVVTLTACGDSGSADTTDALMSAMFKESTSNEAEYQFVMNQPETAAVRDCYIRELDSRGWDSDRHKEFMEATGGTGDPMQINQNAYSQSEQMEKFGALMAAGGNCRF